MNRRVELKWITTGIELFVVREGFDLVHCDHEFLVVEQNSPLRLALTKKAIRFFCPRGKRREYRIEILNRVSLFRALPKSRERRIANHGSVGDAMKLAHDFLSDLLHLCEWHSYAIFIFKGEIDIESVEVPDFSKRLAGHGLDQLFPPKKGGCAF